MTKEDRRHLVAAILAASQAKGLNHAQRYYRIMLGRLMNGGDEPILPTTNEDSGLDPANSTKAPRKRRTGVVASLGE